MKSRVKLLALSTSLLASAISVSGNVHANAYAFAANNIRAGSIFIGVDTNADGIPDTLNSTFISAAPAASDSTAGATLNGVGNSTSGAGTPPDAPAANGTGSAPLRTNEDVTGVYYNPFGQLGTAYSWGDAIIVSEQTATTAIVARAAAETNIPVVGAGTANGLDKSSTTVTATINAAAGCGVGGVICAVRFAFEADPYLFASLDAAAAGIVARSAVTFSITLTRVGDLLPTFAWAPNGGADGIIGGTETADAENLNLTREVLAAGNTAEFSGPYAAGVFGSFAAFTGSLTQGAYTLSIAMTSSTEARRSVPVPEPGTLALLGLGLAGLGTRLRRKQA